MSKVIDRIQAKVTRAKQHIQNFRLALDAFRNTNPYRIEIKDDTQAGHCIYYVAKVDEVPDELTAIAADVLKNLREPLDHIAYQLVLAARNGTAPDWRVYYPITETAADYPANRNRMIRGVRQEVIEAIDASEPYKGGKGHGLWQLNALCKIDKHHLLVAAGSFLKGIEMTAGFPRQFPRIGMRLTMRPIVPLEVGHEVFREAIHPEMNDQTRFTFDVSFNHPRIVEGEPALNALQDMMNLVDGIIGQLGRFLS